MSLSNDSPQLWISSGVGLKERMNSGNLLHIKVKYLTVIHVSQNECFITAKTDP